MRPKLGQLFAVFFLFAAPSLAQDPGKIIDQCIHASGGAKALSKIQTLTLEGVLTVSFSGQSGAYTLLTKSPNRYYAEITPGTEQSIVAYNGKSAWQKQGTAAPSTLLGPEALQVEAAARYLNSRLRNLKKEKFVLRFVGQASVRDRDALQVELLSPYGVRRQIFFDRQSHLIVKESAPLAGADEEVLYGDYRAVSGVQLPHSIELHRGGSVFHVTIIRAAVNAPVREAAFDFPRAAQAPLPDLEKLFKDAQENQKNIDKIKENYAATRTEEETELDGNGTVKRHEIKEFEIFYLNGQENLYAQIQRRQASLRKRAEKGRRSRPQAHRGGAEAPREERSQTGEGPAGREEGRRGRHCLLPPRLPVCQSPPRALPRPDRPRLRLRSQPRLQAPQPRRKSLPEARRRHLDRRAGPRRRPPRSLLRRESQARRRPRRFAPEGLELRLRTSLREQRGLAPHIRRSPPGRPRSSRQRPQG